MENVDGQQIYFIKEEEGFGYSSHNPLLTWERSHKNCKRLLNNELGPSFREAH